MSRRKSKSKAELIAENEALHRHGVGSSIAKVLTSLIQWVGLSSITYFAFRAIDSLSGQATTADIGVSFMADIKVSVMLSWAAGAAGVAYGYGQRKLRKNTVEKLHKRNQELESEFDKRRSSSQLTPKGDTRDEDKS